MTFTIDEISRYLSQFKTIADATNNLTEQAIIDCIPVDDFDSMNYAKNKENLVKYEAHIGMQRLKEEQRTLYRNTNGKKGRYWLACSPKWIESDERKEKTKYEIGYWVNYGDDMTYGWFTVEQIKQWFENPNIYLHEIGGTKER